MHKKILARRLANLTARHKELIAREGFVIHAVAGESVHSHGLTENFTHPELECVLPTDPHLLASLIYDLGQRVKAGARLSADSELADLIENFPVRLVACAKGLRLILPDPQGELDQARMEPAYAAQYANLGVATRPELGPGNPHYHEE